MAFQSLYNRSLHPSLPRRTNMPLRLLAGITLANALSGGMPAILDTTTHAEIDTAKPLDTPAQMGSTKIWMYRTATFEKMMEIPLLVSDGSGSMSGLTTTLDIGLYPPIAENGTRTYGQLARLVAIYSGRAHATQTVLPFDSSAITSTTLRAPDAIRYTFRDTKLHFLDIEGDGTGSTAARRIILDLSGIEYVTICLQAGHANLGTLYAGLITEGA